MNPLRLTPEDWEKGKIVVIDKPAGWTSFDVVNKIRSVLRRRSGKKNIKVGHAGTLDPMATGVLVIGIGPATKLLGRLQADDKTYEGVIRLGATTPSYDADTPPDRTYPWEHVTPEKVREAARRFTGLIEQLPPPYSAVKHKGKKLYELARRGQEIPLKPRKVYIHSFDILDTPLPDIVFRAHTGKGTYIRSLAHDLGRALGSGAYLTSLRRTRSGPFTLEQAVDLNEWVKANQ
ncbi:MAG: tRNA pseudouridine(55) synthase TruB [Chlorobi bacterium]|nr:tRNA pseudouridine(55) synthase TruB [Chlorobiota bacterium]